MTPLVAALYMLLLGSARPGLAANPADAEKQGNEQRLKAEVQELKGYLKEAHDGKRTETERYVILHKMLQDYGLLKSTGTAEAQDAIREWRELMKAHPEFKTNRPRLEIREQRETRERQEKVAADVEGKAASWTPKDDVGPVYGLGSHAAIKFRYRVEFFDLPPDFRISSRGNYQRVAQAAAAGLIKPHKMLTFKYVVDTGYLPPEPFDHPIFLCANLAARYTAHNDEEMAAIGEGRKWKNESGELEDFCGAVSLDGSIIYKLPFSQRYPDQLLHILQLAKDGRKAAIGIGKSATEETDGREVVGSFQKVLIWEFPDKLETIDASDRSKAKAELEKHGLSPWVLGR